MLNPRVAIYYKPDCSECEEARRVLERVRPYEPFELEEIDVTHDRVARTRYGDNVPVVTLNGRVIFRHGVDEDRLTRRLGLARREMLADEEERRTQGRRGRG